MLNQLIESKNHQEENNRKNGFLITTLGALVAVLVSGWTYSLFAKNYAMETGEMRLSNIVAPVAVTEDAPPPLKPEIKVERTQNAASNKIILKDLYEDLSISKNPPKELIGQKDVVNARQFDLKDVKLGDVNQIPETVGRNNAANEQSCGLCENNDGGKNEKEVEETTPEVKVKPTPKKEDIKTPPVQSLGVINGKAAYLAKPPYPAIAKPLRIADSVSVQVLIDEQGNVVSASAVSGHPLLRAASVAAARQSKFSPTYLSKVPVKVTGVIVYKFTP